MSWVVLDRVTFLNDSSSPLLTQGIILVYDITSQKSFDNITKWLKNIEMVRGSCSSNH